jgi:hypothetical protein
MSSLAFGTAPPECGGIAAKAYDPGPPAVVSDAAAELHAEAQMRGPRTNAPCRREFGGAAACHPAGRRRCSRRHPARPRSRARQGQTCCRRRRRWPCCCRRCRRRFRRCGPRCHGDRWRGRALLCRNRRQSPDPPRHLSSPRRTRIRHRRSTPSHNETVRVLVPWAQLRRARCRLAVALARVRLPLRLRPPLQQLRLLAAHRATARALHSRRHRRHEVGGAGVLSRGSKGRSVRARPDGTACGPLLGALHRAAARASHPLHPP